MKKIIITGGDGRFALILKKNLMENTFFIFLKNN